MLKTKKRFVPDRQTGTADHPAKAPSRILDRCSLHPSSRSAFAQLLYPLKDCKRPRRPNKQELQLAIEQHGNDRYRSHSYSRFFFQIPRATMARPPLRSTISGIVSEHDFCLRATCLHLESMTDEKPTMPRIVRGALLQATLCEPTTSPLKKSKRSMIDKHVAMLEQAPLKAPKSLASKRFSMVPISALKQDTKWYSLTNASRWADCHLMQSIAKSTDGAGRSDL